MNYLYFATISLSAGDGHRARRVHVHTCIPPHVHAPCAVRGVRLGSRLALCSRLPPCATAPPVRTQPALSGMHARLRRTCLSRRVSRCCLLCCPARTLRLYAFRGTSMRGHHDHPVGRTFIHRLVHPCVFSSHTSGGASPSSTPYWPPSPPAPAPPFR